MTLRDIGVLFLIPVLTEESDSLPTELRDVTRMDCVRLKLLPFLFVVCGGETLTAGVVGRFDGVVCVFADGVVGLLAEGVVGLLLVDVDDDVRRFFVREEVLALILDELLAREEILVLESALDREIVPDDPVESGIDLTAPAVSLTDERGPLTDVLEAAPRWKPAEAVSARIEALDEISLLKVAVCSFSLMDILLGVSRLCAMPALEAGVSTDGVLLL